MLAKGDRARDTGGMEIEAKPERAAKPKRNHAFAGMPWHHRIMAAAMIGTFFAGMSGCCAGLFYALSGSAIVGRLVFGLIFFLMVYAFWTHTPRNANHTPPHP
jgi:hypothetical protein